MQSISQFLQQTSVLWLHLIADWQTLPAAVRGRQGGDHDQEAAEARRDERPLRRQRGNHQEAPGPLLQSHRARHRLLREPRHRQEGRCGCELLPGF